MKSTKKTSIELVLSQQEAEMLEHLVKAEITRGTGLHATVRSFLEQLETALSTVTR